MPPSFVHDANIALYRKLIAESEQNSSRDENRHQTLLKLLAEEIVKDKIAAQCPDAPAAALVKCMPEE